MSTTPKSTKSAPLVLLSLGVLTAKPHWNTPRAARESVCRSQRRGCLDFTSGVFILDAITAVASDVYLQGVRLRERSIALGPWNLQTLWEISRFLLRSRSWASAGVLCPVNFALSVHRQPRLTHGTARHARVSKVLQRCSHTDAPRIPWLLTERHFIACSLSVCSEDLACRKISRLARCQVLRTCLLAAAIQKCARPRWPRGIRTAAPYYRGLNNYVCYCTKPEPPEHRRQLPVPSRGHGFAPFAALLGSKKRV